MNIHQAHKQQKKAGEIHEATQKELRFKNIAQKLAAGKISQDRALSLFAELGIEVEIKGKKVEKKQPAPVTPETPQA